MGIDSFRFFPFAALRVRMTKRDASLRVRMTGRDAALRGRIVARSI